MHCKDLFRFVWGGYAWGKSFCRLGRCRFFAVCGFAPDWWVGRVGRVYAFRKCRLIPPHQSLTRQTACSFLPTQGEAFLTLCEHGGRSKHGRYGKYHFVLWVGFATRPQATDEGRQHCSRSSSCRAVRKDSRKKASPWGEAGATATDEGGYICTPQRNVSFPRNGTPRVSFRLPFLN